jgi:hypothetical protein
MTSDLFRSVNERICELSGGRTEYDLVCECGDDRCTSVMQMQAPEYEAVLARPGGFAVLPGHEGAPCDEILDYTDRYVVVRRRARDLEATGGG